MSSLCPPSLFSTLFFLLSPLSVFPKQGTWSHDTDPAAALSFATIRDIVLGCLTFHFPSWVHCETVMSSLHFIHGTFPSHFQHFYFTAVLSFDIHTTSLVQLIIRHHIQPTDTHNPLEPLTLERPYSFVLQNHVQKCGSLQLLFLILILWASAVKFSAYNFTFSAA